MLASLLLAALSPAAPIPKDTTPTGPAPRVVELKPGQDGKITITVRRTDTVKVPVAVGNAINPNGGPPPAVKEVEQKRTRYATVELGDVKELKAYTAAGKELDLKETLAKLQGGGVVVMSADGKRVDSIFTRVFKEDTVVLVSPEFVGLSNTGATTIKPGVRPLPPVRVRPGGIQVLPIQKGAGGIQIQVLPAVEQPILLPPPAVEKK
jgi:hypothetical protein